MSKKTKKAPAPRKVEQSRVRPIDGRVASRSAVSRRHSGKPEFNVDLQAVRIVAAVLGVLVLAGLIAMVVQLGGEYPPNVIVTVVLLALIVGLSAFAAIRTEDFVRFFSKLTR